MIRHGCSTSREEGSWKGRWEKKVYLIAPYRDSRTAIGKCWEVWHFGAMTYFVVRFWGARWHIESSSPPSTLTAKICSSFNFYPIKYLITLRACMWYQPTIEASLGSLKVRKNVDPLLFLTPRHDTGYLLCRLALKTLWLRGPVERPFYSV